MDKLSRIDYCVTIGRCKISCLLFADDLVFLASSESGLQHALNGFAAACDISGIKINTSETEVLHVSRNPVQCYFQVNRLSFEYFEVVFTSDGRQDEKLDVRSRKESAAMRVMHHSVVLKQELARKTKFSAFKSMFVSIFTYGHESWVMTGKVRSQMRASEMRFLRKIQDVTMFDKLRNTAIGESVNIESLLLRIKRSQLK